MSTYTHGEIGAASTETVQAGVTCGAPEPAVRYPSYDGPWNETDDAKNPHRIDGDVVFVKLTRGLVGVCDLSDWDRLKPFRWTSAVGDGCAYWLCRNTSPGLTPTKTFQAHRLVLGFPNGVTDHINRNGLDNRRQNLRVCSVAENNRNRGRQRRGTSGLKGVSLDRVRMVWRATIRANGKDHYLGRFKTKEDAAMAYDEAAKRLHGNFAALNGQHK